jgi:heavy metal sensor kinase
VLNFLRSIRFRLSIWFVTALTVIVLVVSLLLYLGLRQGLIEGLDASLREAAKRSVDTNSGTAGDDATTVARALALIRNAPARLLTLDGAPIESDPFFPAGVPLPEDAVRSAQRGEEWIDSVDGFRILSAPVRVNEKRVAIIQTAASLRTVDDALLALRNVLIVLLPAALGLAAIGGMFFAGQALAPMERVRKNVERIEATNLSQRVGMQLQKDEIGALAHTFDGLLDRVESAVKRERTFASDASHELRSPLTVLKAEVGAALTRPRTAEHYQRTLGEIDTLADELNAVVDDLLTLSRSTNHALKRESLDLAALCVRISERMRTPATAKGLTLHLTGDAPAPFVIAGDALKLQRAIGNLLDNAVRYTQHGSITLHLNQDGKHAVIAVEDSGQGIAPEHQAHVFERFYRAESDRGRDTGGTGLGLAIVKAIVDAHGGTIALRSEPGVGTLFEMRLPIAAA